MKTFYGDRELYYLSWIEFMDLQIPRPEKRFYFLNNFNLFVITTQISLKFKFIVI